MPKQTQISVAMKNEIGGLCRLCGVLARAEVNIMGLCDRGLHRRGVRAADRGRAEEGRQDARGRQDFAPDQEILLLELENEPGALQRVPPSWPTPASTSTTPTARPTCTAGAGPWCCGCRTSTGPWPSWKAAKTEIEPEIRLDTRVADIMLRTRMRGWPRDVDAPKAWIHHVGMDLQWWWMPLLGLLVILIVVFIVIRKKQTGIAAVVARLRTGWGACLPGVRTGEADAARACPARFVRLLPGRRVFACNRGAAAYRRVSLN